MFCTPHIANAPDIISLAVFIFSEFLRFSNRFALFLSVEDPVFKKSISSYTDCNYGFSCIGVANCEIGVGLKLRPFNSVWVSTLVSGFCLYSSSAEIKES